MTARHVLSVAELGAENLARLVNDSVSIAQGRWEGARTLEGKVVGIYFQKTSTRTRTSFTVGAMKLGASTIAYGPNDLQIVTGETLADTGRVLANFLDVLVVRTNGPVEEMRTLGAQGRMSIVNAMSNAEHPTQAIADLSTIKEALGTLDGVHVLYLGEGNNSAASLALAVALTPRMRLTLVTPTGYGLAAGVLEQAREFCRRSDAVVEQHHRMDRLPKGVDAVYTTRWLTMGLQRADSDWLPHFRPYSITSAVLVEVSKPSGTIFLHDLPAMRGFEVVDEVLDGPQSIVFRQAFHKMTSAMAVLNWCVE